MSYSNSPFGTGALSMTGTATLSDLRSEVYNLVNEPQTSSVYSTDTVDSYINDQVLEICTLRKWQFLRQKQMIIAADNTTLSENITTATTSFDIGAVTNLQEPGAIWLNGDVINYVSISSTTLQTVTNIEISHTSGEIVYPLYKVPSDYLRSPQLLVQPNGSDRFDEKIYVDAHNWDLSTTGSSDIKNKWTIITDNSEAAYLMVNNVEVGDIIKFHYQKRPGTMTADSDTCDIPDPWALKIIPKRVAYKLMILRNDDQDGIGTAYKREADEELFNMKKFFGQREEGWSKLIQPTYRSGNGGRQNKPYVRI